MKIICISDTHNQHKFLPDLPEGDVLVHAGDISGKGYTNEVLNFLDWFSKQPHKYKIFIAGNHDFYFEKTDEAAIKSIIPDNVIYLNDSGIEIDTHAQNTTQTSSQA